MSSNPKETSVYVHFPWCARKCPYCDFATEPIRSPELPHERYADAVLRELESRAQDLQRRSLTSVFFGGGTPSLWDPKALGRTLAGVRAAFETEAQNLEVTVECNPSSLDRARAARLAEQGVDRLSIGVQSLRDQRLQFLGRLHDSERALRALEDATAEVPRVSADLLFGIPRQRSEELLREIDTVVATGVRHVSAYALTIEENTLFGSLRRAGKLEVAPDDAYASMFEGIAAHFESLGWRHYEVSNYAPVGEESRHNLHYWRGGAYVGLGAAAVGCLDVEPGHAARWRNDPIPQRYVTGGTVAREIEILGPEEIVRESLMLGLRTLEGIHLDDTRARAGVDPELGRERRIADAIARGDLIHDGVWLRAPQSRWLKLDGIVRDLF